MEKKKVKVDFKKLAKQAAKVREAEEKRCEEILEEAVKSYYNNYLAEEYEEDEELEDEEEVEVIDDEELEFDIEDDEELEEDEELEFDIEDDEELEEDEELEFDLEDDEDEELDFDLEDDEDEELDFDLEDDEELEEEDEELDFDLEDDEDEDDVIEEIEDEITDDEEDEMAESISKDLEEAKLINARTKAIVFLSRKYSMSESVFGKTCKKLDAAKSISDIKYVVSLVKENLEPRKINKKRMQSASKAINSKFVKEHKKKAVKENRAMLLAGLLED